MQKVQKWKDALTEAAKLAGWDSHSRSYRDDSELIQKIVKDVLTKLDYRYPPSVLKGLVGIYKNCSPLESLLGEAQTVGIWGMGGMGKTTIAKAVFAKYSSQFEGHCFLENVHEKSGMHGQGLLDLRNKLHSELLQEEIHQNSTAESTFVENRLRRQRNLIVLDDVSTPTQLKYLVGELQCYGPSSRIIITTRDKNVLESRRVEKIYEVEELDFQESLRLFCLNAFNEDHPQMGYEEISQRAVVYSKGVPLALIVLGSFLHSKSENEWESALRKLEKIPKEEIQNVFKLSYDGLDSEEKEIFLDIACFLKGEHIKYVTSVLDSCGFYVDIGIRSLRDKALITIRDQIVWMHDLLQGMGWEIVRQECIKNPGKRSRLWDFNDTYDVLKNNKGSDAIEGIMLDMSQIKQHLNLSADAFKKMTNLRFLKFYTSLIKRGRLNNLYLPTGLESFSDKLRYLEWHEYPLQSLPSNFCPEQLVSLLMPDSQFEKLWDGKQNLVHLEEVDLRGCEHLMELPDFSMAQNLERVILSDCRSLCHVHSSILSLGSLEYLYLNNCQKLESLEINLRSLRDLDVNGCSSLRKFWVSSEEIQVLDLSETGVKATLHWSIGHLSKVKAIWLNGLGVENLPNELSCLRSLAFLSLSGCGPVIDKGKLHVIFDALRSLKELHLKDCHNLCELPDNICLLSSLHELRLDNSGVVSLPASIKHLSRLETLSLNGCTMLQSVPELPPSLIRLHASNCTLLQTVAFFSSTAQLRKGCRFCYPASRVPEWFPCRTTGASITVELSLPFNGSFNSLLCVVLSPFSFPATGCSPLIRCEYFWETGNIRMYGTVTHFPLGITTEMKSDHVYIRSDAFPCGTFWGTKARRINEQCTSSSYNPKVTFKFYVEVEKYAQDSQIVKYDGLIKECGLHPFYPSDNQNVIIKMEWGLGIERKRRRDIVELEGAH